MLIIGLAFTLRAVLNASSRAVLKAGSRAVTRITLQKLPMASWVPGGERGGGAVIHISQNHRTTGSAASLSPHPISPGWLNSGETAFNVLTRPPANLSPGTHTFTGDAAGAKANAHSSRHLHPNDYPPRGNIHPIESQIFLSHSQFLSPFFCLFFPFMILH
jgi:hypothetical protein